MKGEQIMAIELINPSGERKVMAPDEYVELLNKYVKTKLFKEWSDRRNIAGLIKLGGEVRVSGSAVEMFLRESGLFIDMKKE